MAAIITGPIISKRIIDINTASLFLAVKDLLGMELNVPDSFKENIIMLRYWNEVFTSVDK